ncbi:MAG TPA: M28 family peptidase [Bacteroidota bacterium]|nr:M28 family peptidase [Bacteroidota bacterium]
MNLAGLKRFAPVAVLGATIALSLTAIGQVQDSSRARMLDRMIAQGLTDCGAYRFLAELTRCAPHRLSGSRGADSAIAFAKAAMEECGFTRVHLEPVMVPHWERGPVESAQAVTGKKKSVPLSVCALGGSVATPPGGVIAPVLEVHSLDELTRMGEAAKGKIVFYDRPMDAAKLRTFEAYSGAVDQRSRGPSEAAKAGALAVLVRSMTLALDDVPHTGALDYAANVKKIPAAAISTKGAELLSALLKDSKDVRVHLTLTCRELPDAPSSNVVGDIVGTEKPNDIIVVSGHLDAWDKGQGAMDDGAGCVQALEALNLIRKMNLAPLRTIRAVLFINEENGLRGGRAYPLDPRRSSEHHVAMIESDAGGFAPRGFGVAGDSLVLAHVTRWKYLLDVLGAGLLTPGRGAADISPMIRTGVPGLALDVEDQRYFDYHHSDKDTIEKVNPRELELGAIAEAILAYQIAQEGL